jgi:hypothetical protein
VALLLVRPLLENGLPLLGGEAAVQRVFAPPNQFGAAAALPVVCHAPVVISAEL